MVRAGSCIDIYVLRYAISDFYDVLYRASSVENAILTGTKKAVKLKLKSFQILDKNYHEIYHGGLANY